MLRYIIIILFYVLLVISFLLKLPTTYNNVAAGAILIGTYFLYKKIPILGICTLPFALLLGVIVRFKFGSVSINLGDFVIFTIVTSFFVNTYSGKINIKLFQSPQFALIGFLLALCTIFSIDLLSSLITLITIVEMFFVFLITMKSIQSTSDKYSLINSWIYAVSLSSILIILAYFKGIPLIITEDVGFKNQYINLIQGDNFFYRASFFVAPFIFPHACVIISLFILLFFKEKYKLENVLNVLLLLINVIAMILMGNKSVMGGVVISITAFLLWAMRFKLFFRKIVFFTGIFFIAGLILNALLTQIISAGQLNLFYDRFGNNRSFDLRLGVWSNVVLELFNNPHMFLIGLGPDVSIRNAGTPFFQNLFRAGGIQQGSVDSGFLFYVINYGVIITTIIILTFYKTLVTIHKRFKREPFLYALLFFPVLCWFVMSFTQQHGISKPAFLIIHYFAIVYTKYSNVYASKHSEIS